MTAVELDPKIAAEYRRRFPEDEVVEADAHEYLLLHFEEFDFIWSSPPCQTHSRTNHFLKAQGKRRYADMRLYQEIVFLKTHFKGRWVVENVISYYEPLIIPQKVGRHYLWSNFVIPSIPQPKQEIGCMNGKYQRGHEKPLVERNATNPELGLHALRCAFKIRQEVLT